MPELAARRSRRPSSSKLRTAAAVHLEAPVDAGAGEEAASPCHVSAERRVQRAVLFRIDRTAGAAVCAAGDIGSCVVAVLLAVQFRGEARGSCGAPGAEAPAEAVAADRKSRVPRGTMNPPYPDSSTRWFSSLLTIASNAKSILPVPAPSSVVWRWAAWPSREPRTPPAADDTATSG